MATGLIDLREGGLDEPQVQDLIRLHRREARSVTPTDNAHSLDLDGLRDPAVTFWGAWELDTLLGIAALKQLAPDHAEIKSMRTAGEHLRKGVSRALLNQTLLTARDRNYARLSLETGTAPLFEPANRLYESFGFKDGPVFGGYPASPHNRFMTLAL